jgi:hypothetical protein
MGRDMRQIHAARVYDKERSAAASCALLYYPSTATSTYCTVRALYLHCIYTELRNDCMCCARRAQHCRRYRTRAVMLAAQLCTRCDFTSDSGQRESRFLVLVLH